MTKDIYQNNLELFTKLLPHAGEEIKEIKENRWDFCKTAKGELNLVKKEEGDFFLHSQEGAKEEANKWFERLFPLNVRVLFVYGIGLGYTYDALKQWLEDSSGRFLVFLEDDIEVINHFLKTERAQEILQNMQVILYYFKSERDADWANFRLRFREFTLSFSNSTKKFAVLNSYETHKKNTLNILNQQITILSLDAQWFYDSVFTNRYMLLLNFYHDLLSLEGTGNAYFLQKSFPNVPLLICGAGPSINNQLDQIKQLRNKALILASGSAVNVLTRNGIQPDLGAAIDPWDTQESRFMTNLAYEVPFLYTLRFHYKALKQIHGFRTFLLDEKDPTRTWFMEKLKITQVDLYGGISTTNFCFNVANFLGCNPIVFVGLDMSFEKEKRYASGVTAHPTDKRLFHKELEIQDKLQYHMKGRGDEDIMTTWPWLFEASIFTDYAKTISANVINATGRGLELIGIPSKPLEEVILEMPRSYDLQNWLHTELQEAYREQVSLESILAAMEEWKSSAEKALSLVQQIVLEIDRTKVEWSEEGNKLNMDGVESLYKLLTELENEVVYKNLLEYNDPIFNILAAPDMEKLTLYPDQFSKEQKSAIFREMEKGRYRYYESLLQVDLKIIQEALSSVKREEEKGVVGFNDIALEGYELKEGVLSIEDPSLGISFMEKFEPPLVSKETKAQPDGFIVAENYDGQALLFYPGGQLKAECYYKKGSLHGPSTFYGSDGTLLSISFFWNGMRVGRSKRYYKNGSLYALEKYDSFGTLHGAQTYLYPHGQVKTVMNYEKGVLDGEILLYFPNGQMKREQHHKLGKLEGKERVWNEKGQLIIESEFHNNLPKGVSRMWHANGRLAKEITFYENPTQYDLKVWDETGKLLQKDIYVPKIEDLVQKSKDLHKAIAEATAQLEKLNVDEKRKDLT